MVNWMTRWECERMRKPNRLNVSNTNFRLKLFRTKLTPQRMKRELITLIRCGLWIASSSHSFIHSLAHFAHSHTHTQSIQQSIPSFPKLIKLSQNSAINCWKWFLFNLMAKISTKSIRIKVIIISSLRITNIERMITRVHFWKVKTFLFLS